MPLIAAYSATGADHNSILRRVSYDISQQHVPNSTKLFPAILLQADKELSLPSSDMIYTCLMTNDICFELKRQILARMTHDENTKIQQLRADLETVRATLKNLEDEHVKLKQQVIDLEQENAKLTDAETMLQRKLNIYEESEWEELSSFVESSFESSMC